jgi:DNA-binding XRE family transcriptional regulator
MRVKKFMSLTPYVAFGKQLKTVRQKAKESLANLAAAVEMDDKAISALEAGRAKPTEDLILMLISHFDLKEPEAMQFWQLAGYPPIKMHRTGLTAGNGRIVKMAFISPADVKIIYTDMVHVSANQYGVVLNFLQGLGSDSQPLAVSRIGMSHIHAKSLIEVLQKTVKLAENSSTQDKKPTK